eukprot:g24384.t1
MSHTKMPMHRLVALLQALGPEERLMVIQDKLTQAQRLALEQWMLKKRATAGCKANLKPQGHYARAINILFDMFSHISVISPWIALASGLRKRRTLQSSQAKRLVEQDCCERGTSSGRHVVHLGRVRTSLNGTRNRDLLTFASSGAMTILHDAMWQAPRELSGVKSRKRAVFEIPLGSMDAASNAGIHRVSGLKVSLESRISALGSGGRVAVELLLGRPLKGQVHRHEELQVAHLSSNLAGDEATVGEHLEAVKSILETRPQVVVLDSQGNASWTAAFQMLLQAKEALRGFRGAIVLVVDEELAKTDLAQFED